ncbi:MAG: bifunctional phosphoglucose/phosphomannose isomerase [Chloroflexota bacterium]
MTDSALDSADTYSRLDPAGLYGRIAALPSQIGEAWRAARAVELPPEYREVERVVVLGMGGSGIGGGLLRALALDLGAATPVDVVRGYTLPAHVDERSLVLASSNSGNTEEVVSTLQQAVRAHAKCVAITTGGRLLAIARDHQLPALTFAWDGEPRSALGWSFASLLAICGRMGLVPLLKPELADALTQMRSLAEAIGRDVPEARNPAKQLARRLAGKLPVFVGAEALAPVAYRWRTQVNENAKSWAIADELPEMNHNAPLGYGAPAALVPLLHVVLLRHAAMHARTLIRIEATLEQMHAAGLSAEVVDVPGPSTLAQMLWAIQLGDFVSYYLGLLNGVDPSEVRALDWIKARLASSA